MNTNIKDVLITIFSSKYFWIALVIIIIFFFIKKPIVDILGEVVKFLREKATKFSIGGEKGIVAESNTQPKEQMGELAKEDIEEKQKATEEIKEPVSLDDWNKVMFYAFMDRDKDKAEEAFKNVEKLTEDETQKKRGKINFFRWNHMFFGGGDNINNIEKYLDDESVKDYANENLADCYKDSKDYQKAIDFYLKALEFSTLTENKVDIIVSLSSTYYEDNQKKEAFKIINDNINIFEDKASLSKLYKQLADLYNGEKDFENRAYCLEKALEFKPNDQDLLFSIGYAYSEKNFEGLALLHYKMGRGIGSKNQTLLNNLGVSYQRLKLPIKSVSLYKDAFEKDETLAGANLAYLYLNAGFAEEAKKIISEANTKKDIHPNIGEAFSTVSKKNEEEDKKEQEILKKAEEERKFILKFAENYFSTKEISKELAPKWIDKSNKTYEVIYDYSKEYLEILWEEDGKKLKIIGSIINRGSHIKLHKEEYNWSYTEKALKEKNEGLLYLSEDDGQINIMIYPLNDYESTIFYTLQKSS